MNKVLGIIGAGKLGGAIGRAASDAGWRVLVNDAAPQAHIGPIVEAKMPDAELVGLPELTERADIVLLALPFGAAAHLDYALLSGKVVCDPMNHWPAVDGELAELRDWPGSTSELVASRNPRMRLVKAINHLSYHDYTADARSAAVTNRRAVAVASDDSEAAELVGQLIDDLGFDPVLVGFDRNKLLEPGGPAFGVWLDAPAMRELLEPPTASTS